MPDVWAAAVDGLLFDCDGVLVDSDASVLQAWTRWARHYRLDPAVVYQQVHGRRAADSVRALLPAESHDEAIERINRYELEDAATVTAIDGAEKLVTALPQRVWAVVTSATGALASARIGAAGLPDPGCLLTADDLQLGKPDPEGYLRAAAALGLDPVACAVLEDAPSGVVAARAAGVRTVIGVGERAVRTDADVVVADLTGVAYDEVAGWISISGPRLR